MVFIDVYVYKYIYIKEKHFNKINICFSLAGMSRSVTIAAAYLMSATTIKLKHVLRLLKACRSIASPNEGFGKQLQYFECNYLLEVGKNLF